MSSPPAAPAAPAASHESRVRTLFDAKAARWPGKYAPGGPLAGRLGRFTAAVAELSAPGAAVLDLGCGSGELALRLAAAGYRMAGCDIAQQMLNQAAAADRERAVCWHRLPPGWRTLPTAAGSLDVVVASSVFEYLADPGHVLGECARVLRPGGTLLCTVPDPAHPVRWLEFVPRLAARTPLASAAGRAGPRAGQYAGYLRATARPHGARWWQAAAGRHGLDPARVTAPAREPLRLLAFTRRAPIDQRREQS